MLPEPRIFKEFNMENDTLFTALKALPPPRPEAILVRLKSRVQLEREAQAAMVVSQAVSAWRPFAAGIERQDVTGSGKVWGFLLRMEPGAILDGHRHWFDEASYCLQGKLHAANGQHIGVGDVREFVRGSHHPSVVAQQNSLIYVRANGWLVPITRFFLNLLHRSKAGGVV